MADLSHVSEAPQPRWSREPDGACHTADGGVFGRSADEPVAAARAREEAAKAVCAGCDVRVECRRHALAAREPYGVWGGLTADERRALFTGDPVASAA
ncbi:WhiB family transcriptional regulator [Kitasatospora sp. NPDC092039]|uniref:WhiB family transcriptional regulator n=1 Tax=Kitasatospora sp. NPDC092039 TaxID=3364086 RepID=UPI0038212BA3